MPRHSNLLATFLTPTLLTVCFALASSCAHTQTANIPNPSLPRQLTEDLENRRSITVANFAVSSGEMHDFYAARGFQAVWVDSKGLTPQGEAALSALAKSGEHGLNPASYGVSGLRDAAQAFSFPALDDELHTEKQADLELSISAAVARYGVDLHDGRTIPQRKIENIATHTPITTRAVLDGAATAPDITAYMNGLAPQTPAYKQLQATLQEYKTIAENGGWPSLPAGLHLKEGDSNPAIATLRTLLTKTGDLATATDGTHFDAALTQAVKNFQTRHGLTADGAVGGKTLDALNIPVQKRIEQIQVSLERMRWMPTDMGARYVLVNVPGYTLTGVENGKEAVTMPVIVGRPVSRTPIFSNQITEVIFNPTWHVPHSIAVKEMLPKIRKNPNYLQRAGYRVTRNVDGRAVSVNPTEIDWEEAAEGGFRYSFNQPPGGDNALGKIKFNIPNADNIYLHSTSQPKLFAKDERALSHGCVRLGDPLALAKFVLGAEGWADEKIASSYDASATKTVRITPIPVHLVYWSAWADGNGRPHFTSDVYNKDAQLAEKLDLGDANSMKLASAN